MTTTATIDLAERGLLPTAVLRWGIRRLLEQRLKQERRRLSSGRDEARQEWLSRMRQGPVAPVPERANEQHYEVPAEFFQLVLGRRLKYSSGLYEGSDSTLDDAEEAMLRLTTERADLADGQRILELGCGWGSLSLWMAERFPHSEVVAVSNSSSQKRFIDSSARARGVGNLRVVTADMNGFAPDGRFDRVVSVEMFEQMRNWETLLARIFAWLRPGGRLFVHTFAHQELTYPFEVSDETDWMAAHFFTGGMMPSRDLLSRVSPDLEVEESWWVLGDHYARTAEDWRQNLERHRDEILPILGQTYGPADAEIWFQRWRLFFLACAELFAYGAGREWGVVHTRLRPKGTGQVGGRQ